MCACVRVCVCVHACTCTCACLHACLRAYVYVRPCVRVCKEVTLLVISGRLLAVPVDEVTADPLFHHQHNMILHWGSHGRGS